MTERLTTLAALKDWLDLTSDGGDTALVRLIDAASQFALDYMSRDSFRVQQYTENCLGNGKGSVLLRNWPVVTISSVGINGRLSQAATLGTGGLPSSGYTISDMRNAPQTLNLWGGELFWYRSPCQFIYTAGFQTSQSFIIPEAPTDPVGDYITFSPTATGQWIGDIGVTIDGVDATKVGDEPVTGEYSVDEWGTYTFNATADEGKEAVITYDYVPWSIAHAVTELIGEWYRRKDRIGLLSKTLGGQETVTFSQKDMNATIKDALQYYANVVPY